jgi:membrane associated rhomboid family serine protease
LIGIVTGPLIHGDIFHLISNTIPIVTLCTALFYFYYRIAGEIFAWIYLITGFWVWLLARDAYHIGASGIVYGLASFLFFSGIFRRNSRLLVVTLIVLFLYGGMVYGVFPNPLEPRISWESHALGAVCGVLLAIYFRKIKVIDDHGESEGSDDGPGKKDDRHLEDPPFFSDPTSTDAGSYTYRFKEPDK